MKSQLRLVLSATVAAGLAGAAVAQQGQPVPSVVFTLENSQPERGVFLTPPWIALHDGSFDTYDNGAPASVPLGGVEIERLAEDGNNAPLAATFAASLPNAPQVVAAAGPSGPLGPGARVGFTLNVDPTMDRFLSYASMVIPSNDAFIANGNPLAHEMFDATGTFVGVDFTVSGDETHDAGTEVNDEIAANVAFLGQSAPDFGVSEGSVVTSPSPGFSPPGGLAFPDGVLNHPVFGLADFNDADDRLLTVRVRFVDLGGVVEYGALLTADQELQPDVVLSPASAAAKIRSFDGTQLGINAVASGLSGPLVAAHLHLGPAGSNGPVVVDLGAGINAPGSGVRLLIDQSDLTGPLQGASFISFLNEVAAGNVYVNFHTAQFPGGEIRGQIQLVD